MTSHLPKRTPLIQAPCLLQCQCWSLSASCPCTDPTRTFCCRLGSLEVKGVQQQRQVLHHALGIIKQACTEYAKLSSDIIDPWTEHCSRNVSYHTGPLPLCRVLRVVVSCSASHPGAMYMDKGASPVQLASTFQENSKAATSFQLYAAGGSFEESTHGVLGRVEFI